MKLMQNVKTSRKGLSLSALPGIALAFILITVIMGVGALILSSMNDQVSDANATAIINVGTGAISDLSTWLPIIAVVVAAVVIIGLIVRGFSGQGSSL